MSVEGGPFEVLAAPGVDPELARSWGEDAPRWFGPDRLDVPGAEGREHLAWLDTPLGPAVAKRERPVGWKRSLVRIGGRELRSARAFHAARELQDRGIGTAEPLAFLARRRDDEVEGILLTRYVEGSDPWTFARESGVPLSTVLEALAAALARLHAAGYRHRDLKALNILVRVDGEGTVRIAWIDLDGLARPERLGDSVRLRDLARLCASFETREARAAGVRADAWPRLLEHYLERARGAGPERGVDARLAERALGATRRWARRHVERNLARGRPLS